MTNKKNIGVTLITFSLSFLIIDIFLHPFPSYIGKIFCDHKPIRSTSSIGDLSCELNIDIFLFIILVILLIFGLALITSAEK